MSTTNPLSARSLEQAFNQVRVAQLLLWLNDDREIALVDVRDEGVLSRDGQIVLSVPLPLSQLELRVARLLPRRLARVVVIDEGKGETAARAAVRLGELGYSDVHVLTGGLEAWRSAGQEVYTGSSPYSKAFGEFVEHQYKTPYLSVDELHQRLAQGDDLVVVDGRTAHEFEDFSIAGAHSVPNAELPLRVGTVAPSADTLVVVNCAGRTRSIIGAQALINAGLPNKVVSLRNGTMDWLMAGHSLAHGQPARLPAAQDSTALQGSVDRLTRRFGLQWINDAHISALEAEREQRSLYVFDIRTRAEYEAGHRPGSAWIEGGQLIQGLDQHIGVRGSRIVVLDDGTGVRAAITASWLEQLGWGEVLAHVWTPSDTTETGLEPHTLWAELPDVASVSPGALAAALERQEVEVLDLATAPAYEAGHVPSAVHGVRARLPAGLEDLAADKTLVLTSPDGRLARLAASEIAEHRVAPVVVLEGGTHAWRTHGGALETGATRALHATDDAVRSPYHAADTHAAFREYLRWEIDLLDQVERDPLVRFRTFDAAVV